MGIIIFYKCNHYTYIQNKPEKLFLIKRKTTCRYKSLHVVFLIGAGEGT